VKQVEPKCHPREAQVPEQESHFQAQAQAPEPQAVALQAEPEAVHPEGRGPEAESAQVPMAPLTPEADRPAPLAPEPPLGAVVVPDYPRPDSHVLAQRVLLPMASQVARVRVPFRGCRRVVDRPLRPCRAVRGCMGVGCCLEWAVGRSGLREVVGREPARLRLGVGPLCIQGWRVRRSRRLHSIGHLWRW
jgi:hypothetical protein